jgi:hypothetical protein
MAKGATVRGRIVLEGAGPQDGVGSLQVLAVSTIERGTGPGAAAPVSPDGTFELRGVHGMNVFRVFNAPSGWSVKAVALRGADITDTPMQLGPDDRLEDLEVRLSKQQPRLTITLTDRAGHADRDAILLVFSTDSARWGARSRFVKSARFDGDGKCEVAGLPPGSYFVATVANIEQGAATDPEFLAQIKARATSVVLREGETQQLVLTR